MGGGRNGLSRGAIGNAGRCENAECCFVSIYTMPSWLTLCRAQALSFLRLLTVGRRTAA
eukprot:COSAG03_NODE_134_length_11903_cov_30.799729_13_plen_59_part_00